MAVKIEATGNSVADALAGVGSLDLEHVATEDLLAELRERLVSQKEPMVVRILPFADVKAWAETELFGTQTTVHSKKR